MIALPDYTSDASSHWGIPIFQETKLLFKDSTTTELSKQTIALLIAKQFAEFVRFFLKLKKLKSIIHVFSGLAMLSLSNGGTNSGYKKVLEII